MTGKWSVWNILPDHCPLAHAIAEQSDLNCALLPSVAKPASEKNTKLLRFFSLFICVVVKCTVRENSARGIVV